VVADGTPGWQRQQADKILDELNALLSSPHPILVARSDAEPVLRHGFAVRAANRDQVMVSPRTPMRDTMEMGFALLRETPRPRTMIVIAQQQLYPTAIRARRLPRVFPSLLPAQNSREPRVTRLNVQAKRLVSRPYINRDSAPVPIAGAAA
jgi:hypothetical protein